METPNIYNRGKIYKLVCNVTGLVYIGSTTQKYLCQRLAGHNSNFKSWTNQKTKQFCSSFEVLKLGNYSAILIEECNCQNKDQLHARERFHIENTNKCVNLFTPNQTHDEIVEYNKKYQIENKAKLSEYRKKYYLDHKNNRGIGLGKNDIKI